MVYESPSEDGWLRQGEILDGLWEHRVSVATGTSDSMPIQSISHARVVVLTADCDLEWDYKARQQYDPNGDGGLEAIESASATIPWVVLCDLHLTEDMRQRVAGSDIWKRVVRNQDERYHILPAAQIGEPSVGELPSLVMDFKKAFSIPTSAIYQAIEGGEAKRIAIVPPIFVHDLMHRFFGFLSRVGTPE